MTYIPPSPLSLPSPPSPLPLPPHTVLADVVSQALRVCEVHKITISAPRILQRLIAALGQQEPHSHFENDYKKNKSGKTTVRQQQPQVRAEME